MKLTPIKTKLRISLLTLGIGSILAGCGDDIWTGQEVEVVEPPPAPVNALPEVTTSAVVEATAQTAYSYVIEASDADGDAISMQATQLPGWLAFDEMTSTLSGMPSTADLGEHQVEITLSDGTDEVPYAFTISVSLPATAGNWTMVWSDEFDGTELSAANWNIETGDGSQYGIPGWGNNELEWYSAENISVDDGNLIITAKEEPTNGYPYTSGRLRTDNKVDIKYGRIEARIQVPAGQGLWSAFWMLPTNSQYGGWASGGEIDIMEAVNPGVGENEILGTLHYGMAWPFNVASGEHVEFSPIDDYHIYAIEWEQDEIRWYLNDLHYATITSDTWWSYYYAGQSEGYVSAPAAPFNQDFHILLNLAVGGNLPGAPNGDTVFPTEMRIDYVRVYQCDTDPETGVGCVSNINSTVEAPPAHDVFTDSYTLYDDAAAELSWQIGDEEFSRSLQAAVAWDNNGAISLSEVDAGGDHGMVMDITTSSMGNVAISAVDGESIGLFGMGTSTEWWRLHSGELKFDLYIDSAVTPDDSSILIKMDSGWPALGYKTLPVADLAKDEWISISVPVNDLIATPGDQALDTANVLNVFVIEFTGAAHVQVDNITLACGHPNQGGCGIYPPQVELDAEVLEVFIDEVNDALWTNGIGAWDTGAGFDYFDGASGNHVTWEIVDSGDAEHANVLEVSFSENGSDGLIYIQSAQPVDLADFSDGNLIFDVKVLDYAGTTNGLSYKVDCVFPCTTGDTLLGVIADGEWETVTIPVADLITNGLNINSVNTGLVLFPTWGDQQGVRLQLDNVRWQVGEDSIPAPEPGDGSGVVIYDESVDSNWSLWDCCGGSTFAEVADDAEHGTVAEFTFNATPTVAGFEAATPHDASGLSNPTLEFDLKMLAAPAGDWLLKLESDGAATAVEVRLNTSSEGVDPSLDTWQHFTFDLSALAGQGLDLSQLKLVMVFPTWGQADGTVYRIDNVEIKSNE